MYGWFSSHLSSRLFGGVTKPFHSPSWQVFQGIAQQHEAQREGAEIDMEESDAWVWRGVAGVKYVSTFFGIMLRKPG